MSRYSSLNPNADYSRGVPSLCPDDVSNHSARSGHSFLALRSTSSDWVSAKEKRTMAKFINVVGTIVILWSVVTLRVIIYHSKQLKDCLLVVVRVPLKVEGATAQLHPRSTKKHTMGSTGEAIDQYMLAPKCSPIHPRLLRQSRFKTCLRPGYFLLQSSDCMLETCMQLAGVRVHKDWRPH